MKKTLTTAALSSAMVLGLTAIATAAIESDIPAQTTPIACIGATKVILDGDIRMRGYMQKDYKKDSASTTAYDGRVRLGTKARVSDFAVGYVQLETGDSSGDTYQWGYGNASGLHTGGSKQVDGATDLSILQAWIDYSPGNWGVKVGHMPLSLGNKLFFDHTGSGDDAILLYGDPMENTHAAVLTIKFDEQYPGDNSDDLDGYVGLITHKYSDTLKIGANWTYLKGGSSENQAGDTLADGTAYADSYGQNIGGVDYELAPGMEFNNIGLTVDGKVDAFSYMLDGEFQFGDYSQLGSTTVDAKGWAVQVAGTWDLGGAKVGLLYGYGSGDDDASDADVTDDNDNENFTNFLTDTRYQTTIIGYRQKVPGQATKNTGLANLSLYQINASTKTTCPLTGKELALKGRVTYAMLNEEISIAGAGSPKEDELGTELEFFATWKLDCGLSYKIEAAYLFSGDAWKTSTTGAGSDPDDQYFLRNGFELQF